MKIHVLSERASCSHLSWANNFEFEDIIAATCNATILAPRQRWAHTRWEPVTGRLRKGRYRKVDGLVDEGADLLIVVAMGPPALKMLNAIPRWRKRYGQVLAYVPDIYPQSEKMLDLSIVRDLDALFIGYSQMVDRVAAMTPTPVHHLQQAADVLGGRPLRSEKPIGITAFGRQPAGLTAAIAQRFSELDSPSLAWWSPGTYPYSRTPELDRAGFLNVLRASRLTLCYRFEDTNPQQYRGVSPFTARWFEAAAAGAAIAGSAPSCPEAGSPEAIQTIALSTDPLEAVSEIKVLLESEVPREAARQNLALAANHHDWRHRAAQVLTTIGINIPSALVSELRELGQLGGRAADSGQP